ncbi:hypothetical protein BH10ACT8_BH10ACT8_26450 [soil metagenome]|jgi:hypothetical protein
MTEAAGGFFGEVAEEALGVAQTVGHAAEGIYDGATGDWDGAADSAQSMSEAAIGVATGGISEVASMAWDAVAEPAGLPSAHEAAHDALQAGGNALGDGMFGLVGDEEALKSANSFDDGDYLGGLGHMATGAENTIEHAAGSFVQDAEQGASDLYNDASSAVSDFMNEF